MLALTFAEMACALCEIRNSLASHELEPHSRAIPSA